MVSVFSFETCLNNLETVRLRGEFPDDARLFVGIVTS